MVSIELRTKNCFVCGEPIPEEDRVVSGHFRATDCEGSYLSVLASWHASKCDKKAEERKQEEGADEGCLGPFEEWMGVEVSQLSPHPWVDRKRR